MIILLRISILLIYLSAMLLLYVLGVDKYSWISEMDPSMSPHSIVNDSSNQHLVSSILVAFIIMMQLFYFIFEKSKKWKAISVILFSLIVSLYVFR